jgi:hypothetical protein
MSEIIKKKRGRKPKHFINTILKTEQADKITESIISEEEQIILHIPVSIDELNVEEQTDMNIFMKSDINVNSTTSQKNVISDVSEVTDTQKTIKTNANINMNKIITHDMNFNKKTKCWWCKNTFDTPSLSMPEDYYNETFYCKGHFCSFNCMISFNLDSNDSLLWKRESLINLLYYLTYSKHTNIVPAPHWMALEEYGGNLTIEQFRKNSLLNTKEFLILHPPMISRQMQIEESYKQTKLKEVPIENLNKFYSEVETDYAIKRSTPLKSSQLNLETTMGLIKKKKSIKF